MILLQHVEEQLDKQTSKQRRMQMFHIAEETVKVSC